MALAAKTPFLTFTLLTASLTLASLQPAHAQSGPERIGQWSPVYPWPDVGIHLSYLPTGRVLTFSDDDDADYATKKIRKADFTKAYIVDVPWMQGPGAVTYLPNTRTNMFCSGHTFLPNGQLIAFGGHEGKDYLGSTDVTVLDYGTGGKAYKWRLEDKKAMSGGRWYASAVTLPNGDVVIVSGSKSGTEDNIVLNEIPEVWQTSAGGGVRQLSTARRWADLYPPMHVAPNGQVFMSGPHPLTRYLDTSGTGKWVDVAMRQYGYRDYGSSVMYEPGKVMIAGGGNTPTATAEVIDLNAQTPVWQWTGSMKYPRHHMNATILPDGTVLVTGGTSSTGNNATNAVLAAELWDPATGKWTTMASMQKARVYHSSAVLLPDGRVLAAGGGRPAPINGVDNYSVEIYSPPYLFKGPRPRISAAPGQITYNQVFTVQTPDVASITGVTLVKFSSNTHAFNMTQRFNRLSFQKTPTGLNVTAPANANLATPGHYMLFLLNSAGVPSGASFVRIN